MNRPRTTENFPRMKDRAAGRRARKTARGISKAIAILPDVLVSIRLFAVQFVDALAEAISRVSNGMRDAALRSSYALAPPPLSPHAAIDDPEGRELVAAILARKNAAQRPEV